MSRRNPTFFDFLLRAPWWISLLLSPLAFILVGAIAPAFFQDMIPGVDLAPALRMSAFVAGGFFILFAGLSAIHGRQRRNLVDRQTSLETLRMVSWKQFEFLVAEAYERDGYAVSYGFKSGADGGVDLDLKQHGRRILVQCKRWKKNAGAPTVRELYGIMQSERADGGILVTTSDFTPEARKFAAGKPIEMVNGRALLKKVRGVQRQPANKTSETHNDAPNIEDSSSSFSPPPSSFATPPACPKCGGEMVQRTARRGAYAGSMFWGCRNFPKCRGTVSVS